LPPPRRKQTTMVSAERTAAIVEARARDEPFSRIGARWGISPQRAHRLYADAVNARPSEAVDACRAQLSDLADMALAELIALAMDTGVTARVRVEAWSSARGWAERLARMHGVDVQPRDARSGDVIDMQPRPEDFTAQIAAKVIELKAANQ
jgi:hypothetical protein